MKELKKVIIVGNSKGISLPHAWLDFHKRKYGCDLKQVLIEVHDTAIIILPVAPTGQDARTAQTSEEEGTKP